MTLCYKPLAEGEILPVNTTTGPKIKMVTKKDSKNSTASRGAAAPVLPMRERERDREPRNVNDTAVD